MIKEQQKDLYIRYKLIFFMKSLINFMCDDELISTIDEFIKLSNNKYKDRTQFIIISMQDLLAREKNEFHSEKK